MYTCMHMYVYIYIYIVVCIYIYIYIHMSATARPTPTWVGPKINEISIMHKVTLNNETERNPKEATNNNNIIVV